jgi:diguanylate cyclase (GGDEF)-like protein
MLHKLVEKYMDESVLPEGGIDLEQFGQSISQAYEDMERYRKRNSRAMAAIIAKNKDLTNRLSTSIRALEAQKMLIDQALDGVSQGITIFNANDGLVYSNSTFACVYDLYPNLTEPGVRFEDVLHQGIAPLMVKPTNDLTLMLEALLKMRMGESKTVEISLKDSRYIEISFKQLEESSWYAVHKDITHRHQVDARIDYLSRHDTLTGLPNRPHATQYLDNQLNLRMPSDCLAYFIIDIEKLSSINETLGHHAGDSVLREIGRRLKDSIGNSAFLARIDGDSFAVIQKTQNRLDDSLDLVHSILEVLNRPFEILSKKLELSASIGIAIAPQDGEESSTLMKNAELALDAAKSEVPGSYRFFENEMDIRVQIRKSLEGALRDALKNKEFEVFYQPLMDLKNARLIGAEALVRWKHPENGYISPGAFIPLAEETGLIGQLGDWVLEQACKDAVHWPPELIVAVNLSPLQFRSKSLLNTVKDTLQRTGLDATRLELEITESVMLNDNQETIKTLHDLRGLGIKIAMDDFGTGYSSLGYLRAFPFDKLKIDQSFVRDIAPETDALAIVRTITQLGANLGISVLAEGIETEEQHALLKREGCEFGQGYLFSRPVPLAEFEALMTGRFGYRQSHLKVVAG